MQYKRLYVLVLSAFFAILPCLVHAQSFMNADEKLAFTEASNGHYINARNQVEKLLKISPNAIGANYVMGLVFWEGEGNLLRAMVFLKKAIAQYEARYCDPDTGIPKDSSEQMWHQRMLRELARLYSELDDRNAEINVRTRLSKLYNITLGVDAVWGLMKLNRFDEASKIARDAINNNNGEDYWVDTAYNDLTAIADAQHKHLESHKASLRSVEYHAGRSCVVLMNHARSLAVLLRFDEAMEYLQKAQKAKDRDCVSNPYGMLSGLLLFDAQWQRAISAMLKVRKKRVEPRMYAQTESEIRANTADIFYAMGFAEKAWKLMQTVVEAPQRLGYDSLLKEQLNMSNRLVFYAISIDYLRRLDEHIGTWTSYQFVRRFDSLGRFDIFKLFSSDARDLVQELMEIRDKVNRSLWTIHQQLFKDALIQQNLMSMLVPSYILWPQYNFVIVDTLGRRTAEFLIEYQESILNNEERAAMKPIFDHFRAYIAWRDGDDINALKYIDEFNSGVKPRMTLLVEQIRIIHAMILKNQNQIDKAYEELTKVYTVYPSLFRHFDIKLPVSFDASLKNSNDEQMADIMDIFDDSPRFEETLNAPFVISAQKNGNNVQICLSSNLGTRYACSSLNDKDYDVPKDSIIPIPEIVDNFYHAAFTPKVDLSQSDIHSLDGSPVLVSADQALDKLMKASDASLGVVEDDEEE